MTRHVLDIVNLDQAQTLVALFHERVARSPQRTAYRHFDRTTNTWIDITWTEAQQTVSKFRNALAKAAYPVGSRVGVMMRNCPSWVFFEQAALSLGLVVVPLYPNDRSENVAYIVNDADIKLLLLEGEEQWQNVAPILPGVSTDFHIVSVLALPNATASRVSQLEVWLSGANKSTPPLSTLRSDDLATIVYTSGTTGRPKGVMLSHRNILANAYAGISAVSVYSDDLFLSFLPLSHTLERTVGYYIPMMTGASVAFARSVAELAEDLVQTKPTVLISVPRIFERVYAKIQMQLQEKSPIARKLFQAAVDIGWRRFEFRQGRAHWTPSLLLWPLLKILVANKILAKLGGRMRLSISGGSALSTPIARTFIGLGLPLCQGYGLTESSPVISVNHLEDNIPASIGPALPGFEVKLADNGELLTRNPSIMQGYWNMADATRQIIDSEGWLHTGDLAKFDASGHIYITGRVKEILVLSNGEKVPPVDMEMAISLNPLFEQVLVIGENRPYLCAIVVLNSALWKHYADNAGIAAVPDSLRDPRIQESILADISKTLGRFPGYAQVRRVTLTLEPWTVENSLMTPSLKIRRAQIMEKFSAQIAEMYKGHA